MTEETHNQADYQKLMDSVHELQGKLCAKEFDLKIYKEEMEKLSAIAAAVQKENEQILNADDVNDEILAQLEKYKVENNNLKRELIFCQNRLQAYEDIVSDSSVINDEINIERFIEQNQQKIIQKKRGAPKRIEDETINIIIGMRKKGYSIRKIAKATGVSVGMVHLITQRSKQQ